MLKIEIKSGGSIIRKEKKRGFMRWQWLTLKQGKELQIVDRHAH